ncbi:MAG: PhoH family protein, partial [Elusimicrobiaceae bacterium]|nr:PhoH family protein [Elusimicrobiaceae bacterium]
QIDLPQKSQSALLQLPKILKGVKGVSFVDFGPEDVVRHPLVKNILHAYEKWEKKTAKAEK